MKLKLLKDVEIAEILEDWDFVEMDKRNTLMRICQAQAKLSYEQGFQDGRYSNKEEGCKRHPSSE